MMNPELFSALVSAMGGSYYSYDYSDLSPEEIEAMKFKDECLVSENKKISEASSKIQLLILEYGIRFKDNTMSDEEFFSRKYNITKDLSAEEKDIIDMFGRAVFDTYGIYSEERVQERKLRKERNDLNDKSK